MCLRCANRLKRWKFLLLLGLIMLLAFMRAIWSSLRPDPTHLSEIDKCPACYGVALCADLTRGNVKITPFDLYSALAHVLASRNVFYGTYGKRRVVLKKLARADELSALDDAVCADQSLAELCPGHGTDAVVGRTDIRRLVERAVTSKLLAPDASSLILCPTAERLDQLLANFYKDENERADLFLWTLVRINPEPLVLQILPAEDGWPVPRYYGACGRLVVEEYVGSPLTFYYHEPWIRRARIASSLLEAAQMLTFRSPDFGFYLTDISPDNIAVTMDDRAIFIDLEDIIVVDKNISKRDRAEGWERMQTNDETVDCRNCLAFSPNDICKHRLSDHNYYSICQHILSDRTSATSLPGGFLHSVPMEILNRHADIIDLLDHCAVPFYRRYERTIYGDKLKDTLDKIIKDTG